MKPGWKLKVKHMGTKSPMNEIEAHLLAAILRRATLHQPVSCAEGLTLANSLIEGTPAHQHYLMLWKRPTSKMEQPTTPLVRLGGATEKMSVVGIGM
jgi:hypothetical protein